jgi:hypothetical protein
MLLMQYSVLSFDSLLLLESHVSCHVHCFVYILLGATSKYRFAKLVVAAH